MAVGRITQVTVGSDALDVSTKLRTGDTPTIETLVSNQGQIVFRTSLPIEDLKPVFAHSEEIQRRVEAQHAAVLGEIKENGVRPPNQHDSAPSDDALERALSHMGNKDFQLAERELRDLLMNDPGYTEARELLEIVLASGGQKVPVTGISDRLRAGAEALTRGWTSSAIQNWARGLSAEPSNRIFQLLVLLATTPSAERRSRYLQELLDVSKDLLARDRSEEAHALLLALQTIEDPEGVSPQLEGAVGNTLDASFPSSSGPTTRRHLKPTDTQPTAFVPRKHDASHSSPTNGDSPKADRPVDAPPPAPRVPIMGRA